MATATTDEELLIIEDNDTIENSDIEIKQEINNDNEIINFGEESKKIEISEDLQIDLSDDKKEITVEDIFSEKKR